MLYYNIYKHSAPLPTSLVYTRLKYNAITYLLANTRTSVLCSSLLMPRQACRSLKYLTKGPTDEQFGISCNRTGADPASIYGRGAAIREILYHTADTPPKS